MKAVVAILVLAVATLAAVPMYNRVAAPKGWTLGSPAEMEERVVFQLALKQRNLDVLEKKFWEISDPKHAEYQNFMTPEEIATLVRSDETQRQRVLQWLQESGIGRMSIKDLGDSIKVTTTVRIASAMFGARFHGFHHADGRRLVRVMGEYSIPNSLVGIVELVSGLSTFPVPHLKVAKSKTQANPSNADLGIVPQSLSQLYKVRPVKPSSALNTSQGVIEFEGQSFSPDDLNSFGQQLGFQIPALSASHIIGPNDPSASVEGQLDIEFIAGNNPEADNWYWFNDPATVWLYEWITAFNTAAAVPSVISVSYAWYEGDQCNVQISGNECSSLGVNSYGYVARVNTEFQKAGVRGVSIMVASGDSGANGRTDPDCQYPALRPDYPSSSPYVTSVGGTELINQQPLATQPSLCQQVGGCAGSGTEQAVSYAISNFASGGGFSNVAPQPAYQKGVVTNYLRSGVKLPPASYFNQTSRGFPDVSAIGHNCLTLISGQPEMVGGTSCAAPIFAGLMSLLNQASNIKSGKNLGFLNPLLYQMQAADPTTFTDIVTGNNLCTEDGCSPSCKGFLAAKGWDPVTGLGTPVFSSMLKYVQNN
jgi:tripeptidyl-peptidase-1